MERDSYCHGSADLPDRGGPISTMRSSCRAATCRFKANRSASTRSKPGAAVAWRAKSGRGSASVWLNSRKLRPDRLATRGEKTTTRSTRRSTFAYAGAVGKALTGLGLDFTDGARIATALLAALGVAVALLRDPEVGICPELMAAGGTLPSPCRPAHGRRPGSFTMMLPPWHRVPRPCGSPPGSLKTATVVFSSPSFSPFSSPSSGR